MSAYLTSPPSASSFDNEADYRAAIDRVIERADRQLWLFDHDLVRAQFETPVRHALLKEFLVRGGPRRLQIVVHDANPLMLRMPRLQALLRQYAHLAEVRQSPDECRHLADCQVLADAAHGVRRFHLDWARGECLLDDPAGIGPWWSRYEELWGLSMPVSLVTTTGLA